MQHSTPAHLTVVLGGARSGKSSYAEYLTREAAGEKSVYYLATAEAGDEEMKARIAEHQRRRPDTWNTIEATRHLADAISAHDVPPGSVILLDCVTLLVSNIVTAEPAPEPDEAERAVFDDLTALLALANEYSLTLIVVSNEVGSGIVPMHPLSRLFRDLVGRANQWLASRADDAYLVVAGYALDLKRHGTHVTAGTEGNGRN